MTAKGTKKSSAILLMLGAISLALVVILAEPFTTNAVTGVPRLLSHQGRLLDTNGNLLGGAGTEYCFQFSIYDQADTAGGTKLWPAGAPSAMDIIVRNGVFNSAIGDTASGGDQLDFDFESNREVYLQVDVAAQTGGTCGDETFETLSPRQRIMSSGYAINAATLRGFTASQSADGNEIPVLTSGNLILGGTNPQINASTSNTLTLQGGGGTGNIQFFSSANSITSGGNLTLAGDTLAVNGSLSGNFELSGFVSSNLTPKITNTFSLGTSALRWSNLFVVNASVSGTLEANVASVSQLYIGGSLFSAGSAAGWTDDGSVVRLTTSSDNVGIGTAAIDSGVKFEVVGVASVSSSLRIGPVSAASETLEVGGTASISGAMYINGNVGIGTNNPTSQLYVRDDGGASPATFLANFHGTSTNGVGTDSNALIAFTHSNGANGRQFVIGTGSNTYFGHPDAFGIRDMTAGATVLFSYGQQVGIGWKQNAFGSPTLAAVLDVRASTSVTNVALFNVASSTNTSVFRIAKSGYVGLGTTSPNAFIEIAGPNAVSQRFLYMNANNASISFFSDSSGRGVFKMEDSVNTQQVLITGGTGNTFFNGTGNFGIGDATPEYKFTLNTNLNGGMVASGSGTVDLRLKSSSNQDLDFTLQTNLGGNIAKLAVMASDSATTLFQIASNSFVNIGKTPTPPTYQLQVASLLTTDANLLQVGNAANAYLKFRSDSTGHGIFALDNSVGSRMVMIGYASNSYFNGGNVGVGTSNVDSKFEVSGTASISGTTTLRGLTYTWPSTHGSSGYFLQNNGSGTLTWSSISGIGVASDQLDFDEFADAMTLDATTTVAMAGFNYAFTGSGNVGIGTSNFDSGVKLEVAGVASISGNLSVFGNITSPTGALTSTEKFGSGATVFGNHGTAIGNSALSGARSVALGYSASASADSVAIGNGAVSSSSFGIAIGPSALANQLHAIAIGYDAFANALSVGIGRSILVEGTNAIGIGYAVHSNGEGVAVGYIASASGSGTALGSRADAESGTIAIGRGAYASVSGAFVAGSNLAAITNVYFGEGVRDATPQNYAINGTGALGTDVAGASVTLAGGKGTGSGAGGSLVFQTAAAGSTGSSLNSLTTRLTIDSTGLALFAQNVSVSGNFELTGKAFLNSSASVSGDFEAVGFASASKTFGSGLTSCSTSTAKLLWNSTTGMFSCGTDQTGGGTGTVAIGLREGYTGSFTNFTSLSFDAGKFNLDTGNTDARLTLDWGSGGPASLSQDETVSGFWNFTNNVSVSGNFENTGHSVFGNTGAIDEYTALIGPGVPVPIVRNLQETITDLDNAFLNYGEVTALMLDPSTATADDYIVGSEVFLQTNESNAADYTGGLVAVQGYAIHLGTGTVVSSVGIRGVAQANDGILSSASGGLFSVEGTGTGLVTSGYGIQVTTPISPNKFGRLYGLYVNDQSGAASSYNIYSAGSNSRNYFEGYASISKNLEIGGTASISGTTTLAGLTYTWPSTHGSSGYFLQNNGSGTLTWAAAATGTSVASDGLDFDEFVDSMNLDATTTIASGGFKFGIDSQGYTPASLFSLGRKPFSQGYISGSALTPTMLSVVKRNTGVPVTTGLFQTIWDLPSGGGGVGSFIFANQTASASAQNMTGTLAGLTGVAEHVGTGTATTLSAILGVAQNRNTGIVTTANSFLAQYGTQTAGGTVGTARGFVTQGIRTSGTTSNSYGFYAGRTAGGSGTIARMAGMAVEHMSEATYNTELLIASTSSALNIPAGNYGIYNASPYTNYFASNLGIGDSSPETTFEVVGTASISGTTTLAGLTYTWPSTHGSSGYFLQNNGSGTLTWAAAATGTSVASDGLDFDEFVDSMNLDATTTVAMAGFNYAFTGTGNVGIGTATPGYKLELGTGGDINLASSGAAFRINGNKVLSNKGEENIFVGEGAGSVNTAGSFNAVLGYYALSANTSGIDNVALGDYAMFSNTEGNTNVAMGSAALGANTDGDNNAALGYLALRYSVDGNNNTALGTNAGIGVINGSGNVFLGYSAGAPETGSNTLWIENSAAASSSALIYGEFDNNYLRLNADLELPGTASISGTTTLAGLTYTWPSSHGSSGYFLQNNGSGTLTWASVAGSGVASDSLDFDEFVDSMTLDANLTVASATYTVNWKPYFASNLLPATDDTYTLGDSTHRWADVYVGPASLHIGTPGNDTTISYNTSTNTISLDKKTNFTNGASFSGTAGLEFTGNASFSFVRISDAINVGNLNMPTTAYSRFGIATTTHGLSAPQNLLVSGILEVDGVLYADGGCVGCGGVTSNSLDFDEFKNAMTLDAETTVAQAGNTFAFTGVGNVGIGTTTTSGRLHVVPLAAGDGVFLDKYDSSNGGELIINGNTKTWHLAEGSGRFQIDRHAANNGSFENTDLFISTVGNVGINTTTADTKFEVVGAASASGYFGAGLTDCDVGANDKLLWDSTTGRFSCGADQSGASLTGWELVGSIVSLYNETDQVGIGTENLNGGIKLEVVGVASISGNLYVGPVTGNIGVGTTSPGARIEVAAGGAANGLLISGATTNGLRVTPSNNVNNSIFNITNSANSASWLTVNANGEVIMNGTGNVGIGNTSPQTKLDVSGTASVSNLIVANHASVSGNLETDGFASSSTTFGSGLADCDTGVSSKLLWDASTGLFSCGVDQTSSGGASIGTSTDLTTFTNVSSLSFAESHFELTYPAGGLVKLDWGAGGPASLSQDETVSGWWTFGSNVSVSGGLEVVGVLKGGATTVSSLTATGQGSFANASVSGTFESGTGKFTSLTNSTGTLTIQAHTLGGLVTGNSQNITGLSNLTFAFGSASGTFEATTLKATTIGGDGVLTLSPTTRLQISGNASISSNLEIAGFSSASAVYGSGLTSCNGGSQKLLWDSGVFSCGVDQSGSGGGSLVGFREGFTGGFNNFGSISFDAGKFALDTGNSDVRLNLDWGSGGPASLSEDESVTGHWVFANHASVTGDFELTNRLKTVFASISNALEVSTYASASKYFGGGLLDCDDTTDKLVWTASGSNAGKFSCGVDQGGGSGWSADPGYTYLSTDTDNVGIGTSTPVQKVQVKTPGSSVLEYGMQLQNTSNTTGRTTGVLFSVEGTNNNGKGALVYTRTGSFGVGDFHFLQNTTGDTSNAAIGQEVLTIKNNGNVGIGSTTPSRLLDVAGSFEANSTFGSGLSDCDNATTSKVLWDLTTGLFSCGTDQSGASGAGFQDNGSTVTLITDTDNVGIGTQNVSVKLEVAGAASVSTSLQIGPVRTISETLEVSGTASTSGNLYIGGNVGIRTTAATSPLTITGAATSTYFMVDVASTSGFTNFAITRDGALLVGRPTISDRLLYAVADNISEFNDDPFAVSPNDYDLTLNSAEDLFIAGGLEVDEAVHFDGTASISGGALEIGPATGLPTRADYLYVYSYNNNGTSAPNIANANDKDTGMWWDSFSAPNDLYFTAGGITNLWLDSSGNVGVGQWSGANPDILTSQLYVVGKTGQNSIFEVASSSGNTNLVVGQKGNLSVGYNTGNQVGLYGPLDAFSQFNNTPFNVEPNNSTVINSPEDLYIAGGLEVDDKVFFNGTASVSGPFEVGDGNVDSYLYINGYSANAAAIPNVTNALDKDTGIGWDSFFAPNDLYFVTGGTSKIAINDGNVGIGSFASYNPALSAKLDVTGDAGANGIASFASSSGAPALFVSKRGVIMVGMAANWNGPAFSAFANNGLALSGQNRTEINSDDDLFMEGSLEVNGILDVAGNTSVSGDFESTGFVMSKNGTAALPGFTFQSYPTTGISAPAANVIAFSNVGVESMRITAAGNVGLGTTTAGALLTVRGIAGANQIMSVATVSSELFSIEKTGNIILNGLATPIGNVGIGTSTVTGGMLTVQGRTTTSGVTMILEDSNGADSTLFYDNGMASMSNTSEWSVGVLKMPIGTAAAPTFTFSTQPTTGLFSPTTSVLGFTTAGVERMRIAADGNVGIGTTAAAVARLEVNGDVIFRDVLQVAGTATASYSRLGTGVATNTTQLDAGNDLLISGALEVDGKTFLDGTASVAGQLELSAGTAAQPSLKFTDNEGLFDAGANILGFATTGVEAMRIDAAGNVGIGTTTTNGALFVVEGAAGNNAIANFASASGTSSLNIGKNGNIGIGGELAAQAKISFGTTSVDVPVIHLYEGGATSDYGFGIHSSELQSFLPTGSHWSWNKAGDLQATGTNEVMRLSTSGQISLGTTTPNGMLTMVGANSATTTGPDISAYTTADIYPLFHLLNFTHDNIAMMFDAYYDGSFKSADAGSNFNIYKGGSTADKLHFQYAAGVAAGSTITFTDAMNIDNTGLVTITTASVSNNLEIGNDIFIEHAAETATASAPYISFTRNSDNWTPAQIGALYSGGGQGGRLIFNTHDNATLLGRTVLHERMRIDESGYVMIGTTTADGTLAIRQNNAADIFNLYDGAALAMTVIDGGNVGINTTTPAARLDVNGDVIFRDVLQVAHTATASYSRFGTATTGHGLSTADDVLISGDLEVNGALFVDSVASIAGNFDPATDNTYQLGNTAYRWKDIFLGPGSLNMSSTTGTSGAGANYTDAILEFTSGSSLSLGTQAVGSGAVGSLQFKTGNLTRMYIGSSGRIGLGATTPEQFLEVGGSIFASASGNLFLGGGYLQVSGTTAVTYNRFGTGTTGHSLSGQDDALVSGDLEVNGVLYADGGLDGASQNITNVVNITGSGDSNFGQFIADGGSAADAAFTFEGSLGTGMYLGTGQLEFSVGGSEKVSIRSDGLYVDNTDLHVAGTYYVGSTPGVDRSCGGSQYLGGISVVKGIISGGTCTTDDIGTADFAERFFKIDEDLQPGDIVAAAPSGSFDFGIIGSSSEYQQGVVKAVKGSTIVGIYSTNPGTTIGPEGTPEHPTIPVALAGRVPLRVVPGESIAVGDHITISDEPGVGRKATHAGMFVGTSLDSVPASDSIQTVMVFVNPGYWAPSIQDEIATLASTAPEVIITSEGFPMLSDMFAAIVKMFERTMHIVFQDGLIQTLKGSFGEVQTDKLCVGQTCVTEEQLQELLNAQGIEGSTPAPSATPTPSSTPDATPDVTPDVTPDRTPDATPDITPEPTPDETPEPTPEPTPDETPPPEPEPTP